ncbi:MAG TPA: methylmalonyl-CoA mutase family protein [Beijerinckiaceae bacterium]|nr:methylmalonyl-CoA mutase family protein [Beijerinckiaceae bacterium]
MDDLTLAAEFPAATRDAWLRLVDGVLKGVDFEKKLVARTHDGLRIEPLYEKAAPAPQPGRAACGPWRIAQRMDHPDPAAANALALADLDGGADALVFSHAGAAPARGFGVKVGTTDDLERALEGVMLDLVAVRIEPAPFEGRAAAEQWRAVVKRRGVDPAALDIDFGLDPAGDIGRTGEPPMPFKTLAAGMAETTRRLREAGFAGPTARVDTRAYHEAGASEAQELAAALATGVAYLRALEGAGLALAEARRALSFLMVADGDEFLTIAKLRALRRVWARVEEACGVAPEPIRLHTETAWRMATRRDPWVNLLRGTIAAFSAGIGGADGVTVLPFTAALGLPDAFARRLARNTQLILLEESNLWRVADPAAGSGGFEALTEALGEKAWALFQDLEREGGIVASLAAGALQAHIAAVRTERERAVATRREPITSTSAFPNLSEAEVKVLLPRLSQGERPSPRNRPGEESAAAGEAVTPHPDGSAVSTSPSGRGAALPSLRVAEPYERLREASDAVLARTGARPKIFLANLGPPAAFTARAGFARNLFEAGGIEAVTNEGFADPAALAEAFRVSGAEAACLCSSDTVYASHAADAARALKGAGCTRVFLAGRPGALEAELRQAGVDDFIHAGSDVVGFLQSFYKEDLR